MLPFSISKILFPVDFSERCDGTAHYAAFLAERFHAEVTLLHAIPAFAEEPVPDFGGIFLSRMLAVRRDEARKQLDALSCPGLDNHVVERLLLEGEAAEAIVDTAHTDRFDLIVMATHGRGLFRRLLLGSVSSKVLHNVACPVWTGIHMEETGAAADLSLRRILCAADLTPHGAKVAQWAAGLARELQAGLCFVHVLPKFEATAEAEHMRRHIEDAARAKIEALRSDLGISAESALETGEVAAAVTAAAVRLHADLLVIGRSPETGALGRLRANAYAIICESPCPVVSV